MSEKCIICDIDLNFSGISLCERHTRQLIRQYESDHNVIQNPSSNEHCIICGEWDPRIIIKFPDWNYICNLCLKEAAEKYSLFAEI